MGQPLQDPLLELEFPSISEDWAGKHLLTRLVLRFLPGRTRARRSVARWSPPWAAASIIRCPCRGNWWSQFWRRCSKPRSAKARGTAEQPRQRWNDGGVTTPIPSDLVPGWILVAWWLRTPKSWVSPAKARSKKRELLLSSAVVPNDLMNPGPSKSRSFHGGSQGFTIQKNVSLTKRVAVQYVAVFFLLSPLCHHFWCLHVLTLHFHVGKSHGCFYVPIIPNISPLIMVGE